MFASDCPYIRRLGCGLALALAFSAHAADRDAEQVKRLKLQMRQIQQDQSAQAEAQAKVIADKSALEQSLKSVKTEVNASKASAAAAGKRAAALAAEIQSLKDDKVSLNDQVTQLQKQLEEQKLALQTQTDQWRGQLADQKGQYQALSAKSEQCHQDNSDLYGLGVDLLTKYENKGFGELLAAKEPIVQMGRVKLENLASQYRDKLDSAKAKP